MKIKKKHEISKKKNMKLKNNMKFQKQKEKNTKLKIPRNQELP